MPDTTGITPDLLLPLAIIWLAPAIWIYIDVRLRGGRAIVWATEWLIASGIALVVLRPLIWLPANAIGLVVYLFVRPKARDALPARRETNSAPLPSAANSGPDPLDGQRTEGAAGAAMKSDRDRQTLEGER